MGYEPRQVVLLKDVNPITELTPIKDSYKATDVGDSINGALNLSVTLGWQDQCGACFESSVAKHVKLFCSDINVIAEDASIKDSYKITDVGDSKKKEHLTRQLLSIDRTNAGLFWKLSCVPRQVDLFDSLPAKRL